MRPQIVQKIALLFTHLLGCVVALGQERVPPPPPQRTPPPGLPLDNALAILVLAGLLLGLYLLLNRRKTKL